MRNCNHKRLVLKGHEKPTGLKDSDFWLSDLSLVCESCGTHLMSSPKDLKRIINIPHPTQEACEHPHNTVAYALNGFGRWFCLRCGAEGIASPVSKLEVKTTE